MKDKSEQATELFNSGLNCSQSVFCVFAEPLGLDERIARKLACPFGGGIGGMRQLCGAMAGAYLAIGLMHGNSDPQDQESKKKTYELIKKFTNEFTARNGSNQCEDLIGEDRSVCVKYVKDAVDILEKLG